VFWDSGLAASRRPGMTEGFQPGILTSMADETKSDSNSDAARKRSREELIAEAERIRAMTPPRKPGVKYPTAEELVRQSRDER